MSLTGRSLPFLVLSLFLFEFLTVILVSTPVSPTGSRAAELLVDTHQSPQCDRVGFKACHLVRVQRAHTHGRRIQLLLTKI